MDKIYELANLIKESNKLVFLTGAGISVASGVSDFKTIYSSKFHSFAPEDIMTKGFLEEHPDVFLEFIKTYFNEKVEPNINHKVISQLENIYGKEVHIITQNIDGLHQKAGSKHVYEIHGNLDKWHCTCCKDKKMLEEVLQSNSLRCDKDGCEGFIRPEIVLYNEDFDRRTLLTSMFHLQTADTLIVIGTRLETMFAYEAVRNFKGKFVFMKRTPVGMGLPREADLEIYDKAEEVFESLDKIYLNEEME